MVGGAGGKGVWGAPGVVYGYQEPDARDPNYDEAAQGDTVYATVVPELEEGELEKNVQPMVLEYFEHGDTREVMASHRELTSRLLAELVARALAPEDIAWAFDKMLRDLPDLILDTPEAPQGFRRVYEELGDISLDVPRAHGLLERLLERCCERGVVTRALRDACPARGRKRFVSEGDGGRVKQ
ncbi:hypothetical protein Q9966_012067 [Columba livia]|nr:hypothetical protein Q9966_012067 [Columba livia]